jgi:hypothetical protein
VDRDTQGHMTAWVVGQASATFSTNTACSGCSYDDMGTGQSGFYSNSTAVTFDDFKVYDGVIRDPLTPGFEGLIDASISSGALLMDTDTRGGWAEITGVSDDDYMIQFTPDFTSGSYVDAYFRATDLNNAYRVRTTGLSVQLHTLVNGAYEAVDDPDALACPSPPCAIKIKLDGTSIKVWHNGNLRIDETDSTWGEGGVAFASDGATIDDLKIGHDVNDDDDLDDAGDDIMFSETFASTSKSPAHDHAGNLVDDGRLIYRYDASALDSLRGRCPRMPSASGHEVSAAFQGCEPPRSRPVQGRRRERPRGRVFTLDSRRRQRESGAPLGSCGSANRLFCGACGPS